MLDLSASHVRGEDADALGWWPNARRLDLRGATFTFEALRKLLSQMPAVRELDLSVSSFSDEYAGLLSLVPELTAISLDSCDIGGETIQALAGLSRLQRVRMARCQIDDEELRPLGGCSELEELHLPALAGEESLSLLGVFAGLRSLELEGTSIQGEAFRSLAACRSLVSLGLPSSAGDVALESIRDCTAIERLHVRAPHISHIGIAALSDLYKLAELVIDGAIDQHAAHQLTRIPALEKLALLSTECDWQTIDRLKWLPRLRELVLASRFLTNDRFWLLTNIGGLQRLHLAASSLTPDWIAGLHGAMPNAQVTHAARQFHLVGNGGGTFRVRSANAVADAPWRTIRAGEDGLLSIQAHEVLSYEPGANPAAEIEALSRVEGGVVVELRLGSLRIDEPMARRIASCRSLRTLDLSHATLLPRSIAPLLALPLLERADFSFTNLCDADLHLIAGIAGLRAILLRGTSVSKAGLTHLAGLANLQEVDVSGTAMESHQLDELHLAMPRVKILIS